MKLASVTFNQSKRSERKKGECENECESECEFAVTVQELNRSLEITR